MSCCRAWVTMAGRCWHLASACWSGCGLTDRVARVLVFPCNWRVVSFGCCPPAVSQETLYADIDMEDVHRTRRAIPTSVQRRLDLYSLQTVRGDAGDGSPAASVK